MIFRGWDILYIITFPVHIGGTGKISCCINEQKDSYSAFRNLILGVEKGVLLSFSYLDLLLGRFKAQPKKNSKAVVMLRREREVWDEWNLVLLCS